MRAPRTPVGAEIKAVLQTRSCTGVALADRLDVGYQKVYQWTRGEINPSLPTLARIAGALDLTDREISRIVRAACPGREDHPG